MLHKNRLNKNTTGQGLCWNIANYVAAIVKKDGCNGGLLVAANNHCLMSKFGKFGSRHC